ncbi:hypothetical protein [uncultured Rikenella sp.]|nr:hypothetical protein [uncultured Rikenella sp.]
MVSVGHNGFCYSSTTIGSNDYCLGFIVAVLYPSHENYRAAGLQLRCLSE